MDALDSVIYAIPRTDIFILLGDFNARVTTGTDDQTWKGVIGSENIGDRNGLLLLKNVLSMTCWMSQS